MVSERNKMCNKKEIKTSKRQIEIHANSTEQTRLIGIQLHSYVVNAGSFSPLSFVTAGKNKEISVSSSAVYSLGSSHHLPIPAKWDSHVAKSLPRVNVGQCSLITLVLILRASSHSSWVSDLMRAGPG